MKIAKKKVSSLISFLIWMGIVFGVELRMVDL